MHKEWVPAARGLCAAVLTRAVEDWQQFLWLEKRAGVPVDRFNGRGSGVIFKSEIQGFFNGSPELHLYCAFLDLDTTTVQQRMANLTTL